MNPNKTAILFLTAIQSASMADIRINLGVEMGQTPRLEGVLDYVQETYQAEIILRFEAIDAATVSVRQDVVPTMLTDAAMLEQLDFMNPDLQGSVPQTSVYTNKEHGAMDSMGPPQSTPNDPYFVRQWGIRCVSGTAGWARVGFDAGHETVIAVLDTGIDYNHPDLSDAIDLERAWNFVGNNDDPMDGHHHGTHVSGIAAASSNNGIGIAGVSEAMIIPIKVCTDSGVCDLSNVVAGIEHAVLYGAEVINMSLGFTARDPLLERACDNAYDQGVMIVAAAGNANSDVPNYPAYFTSVMGVGSVGGAGFECDRVAFYSRRGLGDHIIEGNVEVVAPGIGIFSTYLDGRYRFSDGTSQAAPHVAGLVAIYKERTNWSNHRIRLHIQSHAIPLPEGDANDWGYGRINGYPFTD